MLVGGGLRKLRYAGNFRPGMEYPKYNRATTPMHAIPSKVMRNRRIFWYHLRPDERCWGCCGLYVIETFSFCFPRWKANE
jgi:hypothetical protein